MHRTCAQSVGINNISHASFHEFYNHAHNARLFTLAGICVSRHGGKHSGSMGFNSFLSRTMDDGVTAELLWNCPATPTFHKPDAIRASWLDSFLKRMGYEKLACTGNAK
ncbi:unnamed protein product, partial [Porites evermanni]